MRTVLDLPEEAFDQNERSFVEKIRQHGWFCTGVAEDEHTPSFSYSTGIWLTTQHPECVIFGLEHTTSHQLLWDVFNDVKAGQEILTGRRTLSIFANLPAYLFPVAKSKYASHIGWSRWFYNGDDFPCLQIVWPDRSGLFPWESGFDEVFRNTQPDLTEQGWRTSLVD